MNFNISPDPLKLPELTEHLKTESDYQYERLKKKLSDEQFSLLSSRPEFRTVIALSDFISNTIFSYPQYCCKLVSEGALDDSKFALSESFFERELQLSNLQDPELKRVLRMVRRGVYMAIAWRDLLGISTIEETFEKLSFCAEQFVLLTLGELRKQSVKAFGDAFGEDGEPLPLLVLGMGKLGGKELNFSSDLDLIFAYPHEGETVGGSRSLSYREYFSRIVRRFYV